MRDFKSEHASSLKYTNWPNDRLYKGNVSFLKINDYLVPIPNLEFTDIFFTDDAKIISIKSNGKNIISFVQSHYEGDVTVGIDNAFDFWDLAYSASPDDIRCEDLDALKERVKVVSLFWKDGMVLPLGELERVYRRPIRSGSNSRSTVVWNLIYEMSSKHYLSINYELPENFTSFGFSINNEQADTHMIDGPLKALGRCIETQDVHCLKQIKQALNN